MEFEVITHTLKEVGPERVFILRYLSATLDDQDAQKWAENEVKRLDEIVAIEDTLRTSEADLETKQVQLSALQRADKGESSEEAKTLEKEIVNLAQSIQEKEQKAATLQKQSGIHKPNRSTCSCHLSNGFL